ncbi:aminopeptidase [Desulfatiferula olefinivorans]
MNTLTKKEIDHIRSNVTKNKVLVWDRLNQKGKKQALLFSERYKAFLDACKTEREAVHYMVDQAEQNGFVDLDTGTSPDGRYYKVYRNKMIALSVCGQTPFEDGFRLIGSHIDSPRLDLKQNPLYEDVDLAMMKTHYYGGIRKYHWLARPLALHGSVIVKNGSRIDLVIGEAASDPVFTISDLLPHLAKSQADKKLSDAFDGEKLNILVGSLPIGDEKTRERFKLAVLKILSDRYGMTEDDFISAEIELVPAGPARDVGLDQSLIGAYGQDDRVCAFTSFQAILETQSPRHTAIGFFFDKEEIGSEGNTGAKSRFFEDFVSDLMEKHDGRATERTLRKALIRSQMLSADVNAALEPDYQDVHDKKNAARLGYGVCVTKFTGTGGKSGSSDASAEYMGQIRRLFDANDIVWQTGELGKVDQGGGGTIAKFLAAYGMDIVDCGPALLSMHSPFEISSKSDVYMTFKAYRAFYGD